MAETLSYRPSTSALYYKPPRAFEPLRLTIACAAGVVAVIAIAAMYVRVLHRMETVPTRVGSAVAFAIGVGIVNFAVLRAGRATTPAVAAVLSCAMGMIAIYAAWIEFLHVTAGLPYRTNLILHPRGVYAVIRIFNRIGTLKWQGDIVKGLPLLLCWIAEASMVMVAAVFIGLRATDRKAPTCPECRVPCKYIGGMPRLAADRADEVAGICETQNFAALESFGSLSHPDDPEVNFHLYTCPKCGLTNVLSAYRTAWWVDGTGRATVKSDTLVDRVLIGPQHVEQLKAIKQRIAEQVAAKEAEESTEDSAPPLDESA